MEASELNKILEQHKLWIDGKGGKCANLTYADLTGAYLKDANLGGASLYCANLEGADLYDADLRGANLTGANLTGANLTGANLCSANLCGANLTGVDLRFTTLTGANLTGANLTGANLTGANLYGAKLTGATGLPDISWIIPGCLVQLNNIMYSFYLEKERKWYRFVQDTFGFFIQNNGAEETFDMLVEDRVIRNIPDWVKYSALKQIASESV
jgi:hypothetical protein